MNDDDCCLICGKGPFVSLHRHYAHSPECETAAELFRKPATGPDDGQEEYDGFHQSPPSAADDFSSSLKKRAKICHVQTLHFGDHTNIYDIDQKEDEENTSEIVVQDETNTIPVLSTTGIRFSSADPGIPFSVGDVMKSRLLSLLLGTRSPLYMYDQIMSFCSTAQEAGFIFESCPPRRTTVLKEFQNRFNMNDLTPQVKQAILHDGKLIDVVCFDFMAQVKNLLTNDTLMSPQNVSFDFVNPCKAPQPTSVRSEFHTGTWWIDAHEYLCSQPNDFLVPLMFFIDKTHTVEKGKYTMEPVLMSLGIFTTNVRNKVNAWRPIGLIPKLTSSSLSEIQSLTPDQKESDYHAVLGVILEGVKNVQQAGGFKHIFNFGGNQFTLNVKVPVGLILGDAEGLDGQCGRKKTYLKTARMCRECDCPFDQTDNPSHECSPVGQIDYEELLIRGIKDLLDNVSQRFIYPFWYQLCFGGDPLGVNGHVPPEKLHSIQEGIMDHLMELYSYMIGRPKTVKGNSNRKLFDQLFNKISKLFLHQSDRDLPRCSFNFGFHGCKTKITANERIGVMLIACVVMACDAGIKICREESGMTNQEIRNFQGLFEGMLCYNAWFSKESFDVGNLPQEHQSVVNYFTKLVKECPRTTTSQGWKLAKFHQQMHTVRNIHRFGSPQVFNGGPMEKNLKFLCKLPARTSQKRKDVMDIQSGARMVENMVIGTACSQFLGEDIGDLQYKLEAVPVDVGIVKSKTGGTRYSLLIEEDGNGEFEIARVSSSSSSICKTGVDRDLVRVLGDQLLPFILSMEIEVMCDHTRSDNVIFHAHPSYRGGHSWYDWAEFAWLDGETGVESIVLGQIYGFIELGLGPSSINFTDPRLPSSLRNQSPGVFAIIHSCKYASEPLHNYSRLLLGADLTLDRHGNKGLLFVPVDCIHSPAVVVPNLGASPGKVIQIKPQSAWASLFHF